MEDTVKKDTGTQKKMPPIEKVYEAFTALDDGRVEIIDGTEAHGEARVLSSDGSKSYTVRWDGDQVYSDDNSTYWRGYPGYPVIAVWMKRGIIKYDPETARLFSGVNWKEINTRHRNDYAAALHEVIETRGINAAEAEAAARSVFSQLESLPVRITRKRLKM